MGRFFPRGIREVHFLPTVASKTAPTVANITAGDDLTDEIADMGGWTFENQPITTPDLGSTFDKTIGGPDQAGNPTLTIYDDDAGPAALLVILTKGTVGFVLLSPYGAPGSGDTVEVWPVKVIGNNRQYDMGANAQVSVVAFGVTGEPAQNAVVAA